MHIKYKYIFGKQILFLFFLCLKIKIIIRFQQRDEVKPENTTWPCKIYLSIKGKELEARFSHPS